MKSLIDKVSDFFLEEVCALDEIAGGGLPSI